MCSVQCDNIASDEDEEELDFQELDVNEDDQED